MTISGREWQGWQSVVISKAINQAVSAFSLALTMKQPYDPLPLNLRPDASCELRIENQVLITGYIESVNIEETGNDISISCEGKSKTNRLVKNSHNHPTGEFKNLTPLQIIEQIAELHGIRVISDIVPTYRIDERLQFGETAWEAIERLIRGANGWIFHDDEDGNLVISKRKFEVGSTIEYGKSNVLSWSYSADCSERYTQYMVFGQKAGDDTNFGDAIANAFAIAYDDEWTENDYLLIMKHEKSADQAACLRRANWEAAIRVGKSTKIELQVASWRQQNGELWQPNRLHRIIYPHAQVEDEYLLTAVEYRQGSEGEIATLSFVPPSAYDPEPMEKAKKEKREKKKKKASVWNEDWLKDL